MGRYLKLLDPTIIQEVFISDSTVSVINELKQKSSLSNLKHLFSSFGQLTALQLASPRSLAYHLFKDLPIDSLLSIFPHLKRLNISS